MSITTKQFRRIQTTDNAVNLIQDQLQDLFKSICANPWVFGRPLAQVAFVAGTNQVQHGLGRNFISFWAAVPPSTIVTDASGQQLELAGCAHLVVAQKQQDRSQYVTVIANAPVVTDCFVF